MLGPFWAILEKFGYFGYFEIFDHVGRFEPQSTQIITLGHCGSLWVTAGHLPNFQATLTFLTSAGNGVILGDCKIGLSVPLYRPQILNLR